MKTHEPKPDTASTAKPDRGNPQIGAAMEAELLWQPYRAMSRMLLQTHKNLSAYMEVNRSLAAEMQTILVRAQDMALRMSEKAVARMQEPHSQGISASEIEAMYDFAAAGIREFGEATVAAHIRSIEILRDHARGTMDRAKVSDRSSAD